MNILVKAYGMLRSIKTTCYRSYYRSSLGSGGNSVIFHGKELPHIKGEKNIFLGNKVRLNENCYLYARSNSKIIIGDYTTISSYSSIITAGYDVDKWLNEGPNDTDDIHAEEDILIGDHCWVASKAIILPGVRLSGKNVIVASGAVVTKSFSESNIILGGIPATIIKKLK